jgi:hypothetical protein
VRKSVTLKSTALVFYFFVSVSGLFAQTNGQSSHDCEKLGPRAWKGTSFEERREEEDAYWACRTRVPITTIRLWEKASDSVDPIAGIESQDMQDHQIVFIERVGGTMRCFSFAALQKTSAGWAKIWEEAGDEYCRGRCPPIGMRISGLRLLLETSRSSDKDCEQTFARKEFVWDGKTFRLAAPIYRR